MNSTPTSSVTPLSKAHSLSLIKFSTTARPSGRVIDIFPELVGLSNCHKQQAHYAYVHFAVAKFRAANAALAAVDPLTVFNAPPAIIENS